MIITHCMTRCQTSWLAIHLVIKIQPMISGSPIRKISITKTTCSSIICFLLRIRKPRRSSSPHTSTASTHTEATTATPATASSPCGRSRATACARRRPLVLFAVAVLSELRLRVETEVAGGAVVLAGWSAVDAEVPPLLKQLQFRNADNLCTI